MMQFEVGKTYGGYEFLDTLGSSNMVLAYRVRNVLARRVELLRILPPVLASDQERMERFLREIRVRARLVHPNIVTFYHAGELEGQLIMTTELVEGPTLMERLETGPMPWQEATMMLAQTLAALDFAHANEIVHREVASSNIILTPDQLVKLSGFGLAKSITDMQLTQVGAVVGDAKYMSPEQVKGISNLDGRSDIYSAGAVLYEAVTGSAPFGTKSHFDLMLAQVSTTPERPSSLRPEIPADLDRIIMTALAKEPSQRFQNAAEFRAALGRLTPEFHDTVETPRRPAAVMAIASSYATTLQRDSASDKPAVPVPRLRPITLPEQSGSSQWSPLELTVAGAFLLATMAFLAFLTMSRW